MPPDGCGLRASKNEAPRLDRRHVQRTGSSTACSAGASGAHSARVSARGRRPAVRRVPVHRHRRLDRHRLRARRPQVARPRAPASRDRAARAQTLRRRRDGHRRGRVLRRLRGLRPGDPVRGCDQRRRARGGPRVVSALVSTIFTPMSPLSTRCSLFGTYPGPLRYSRTSRTCGCFPLPGRRSARHPRLRKTRSASTAC